MKVLFWLNVLRMLTCSSLNLDTMPSKCIVQLDQSKVRQNDWHGIVALINELKEKRSDSLAKDLAGCYMNDYLVTCSEWDFLSRDNLILIMKYCRQINSPVFNRFWKHRDAVDNITGKPPGTARRYIEHMISIEKIVPEVRTVGSGEVNWRNVRKKLFRLYGRSYAERPLVEYEITYFIAAKDSLSATACLEEKMRDFGFDISGLNSAITNNYIYYFIFKYSSNKRSLKCAAEWMERILSQSKDAGGFWDTYANVLYKLGHIEKALSAEEKAVSLLPNDPDVADNWRKMKSRRPTW